MNKEEVTKAANKALGVIKERTYKYNGRTITLGNERIYLEYTLEGEADVEMIISFPNDKFEVDSRYNENSTLYDNFVIQEQIKGDFKDVENYLNMYLRPDDLNEN